LLSFIIWCLRGDKFLTGGLAMAILGQSAVLPFLTQVFSSRRLEPSSIFGVFVSMVLVCFGLYRILARVGAADFVDRLVLLGLVVALPQAALWVVLRMNYAFLATKFLLMLLAPLYLGAVIASALPKGMAPHLVETKRPPAPIAEILASFAVACLLFA